MTAAIVAAVMGVPGSQAHHDCTPEIDYRYCGEHVRGSKLPMRFKLNNAGKPSSVGGSATAAAANAATKTWSNAWPIVTVSSSGVQGYVGPCPVVCYSGTTDSGFGLDGQNTIVWGDPSLCGSHGDGVAVACLWYEGDTGPARHRIKEVDIILNRDKAWRIAEAIPDILLGELSATVPSIRNILLEPAGWYDVQSVITHELGHALGLEDIGDTSRAWPADFGDAPKHHQTMYRWYVPGSTSKRTLGEGDILGLYQVAFDSANDR